MAICEPLPVHVKRMNPLSWLRESIRAVPNLKYALAVLGVACVVALILGEQGLHLDPETATIGIAACIGLMVVLVLFVRLAQNPEIPVSLNAMRVLVWFYIAVLMIVTLIGVVLLTKKAFLAGPPSTNSLVRQATSDLMNSSVLVRGTALATLNGALRVANESERLAIYQILARFVRQSTYNPWGPEDSRPRGKDCSNAGRCQVCDDVQTALNILGRRDGLDRNARLDLSQTYLCGGSLADGHFENSNFIGADLRAVAGQNGVFTSAIFHWDLDHSSIAGARRPDTNFAKSHFEGANFSDAVLTIGQKESMFFDDRTIWPDRLLPDQ